MFMGVDEVTFQRPVDVGDLLRLKSCVLHTARLDGHEGERLQRLHHLVSRPAGLLHVEVNAFVTQPERRSSALRCVGRRPRVGELAGRAPPLWWCFMLRVRWLRSAPHTRWALCCTRAAAEHSKPGDERVTSTHAEQEGSVRGDNTRINLRAQAERDRVELGLSTSRLPSARREPAAAELSGVYYSNTFNFRFAVEEPAAGLPPLKTVLPETETEARRVWEVLRGI
jgi:hypothetical protein